MPVMSVKSVPFDAVVNALVPLPLRTPVSVVAPVPPRFTASVPVVSESAIPSDDVARAVGTAEPLVLFASTEFAAIAARPKEFDAPPELRVVIEPVRPFAAVTVVVATFAKVLTPEKYGMLLTTAFVEVERPPKLITEPVMIIGHVPV